MFGTRGTFFSLFPPNVATICVRLSRLMVGGIPSLGSCVPKKWPPLFSFFLRTLFTLRGKSSSSALFFAHSIPPSEGVFVSSAAACPRGYSSQFCCPPYRWFLAGYDLFFPRVDACPKLLLSFPHHPFFWFPSTPKSRPGMHDQVLPNFGRLTSGSWKGSSFSPNYASPSNQRLHISFACGNYFTV